MPTFSERRTEKFTRAQDKAVHNRLMHASTCEWDGAGANRYPEFCVWAAGNLRSSWTCMQSSSTLNQWRDDASCMFKDLSDEPDMKVLQLFY